MILKELIDVLILPKQQKWDIVVNTQHGYIKLITAIVLQENYILRLVETTFKAFRD